jgi:hypothetical protein
MGVGVFAIKTRRRLCTASIMIWRRETSEDLRIRRWTDAVTVPSINCGLPYPSETKSTMVIGRLIFDRFHYLETLQLDIVL